MVVIFRVEATIHTPVKFRGEAFVRVGEHKHRLREHPEKERKIWRKAAPFSFEEGISLSDQTADKVLALIDYPAFFDLLDIPLPDNRDRPDG
jgi:predicted HTH transcriptional regulator